MSETPTPNTGRPEAPPFAVFDDAGLLLFASETLPPPILSALQATPTTSRTRAWFLTLLDETSLDGCWATGLTGQIYFQATGARRPQSLSLLDALIQQMPHNITIKSARDRRYILCNKAGEANIGRDAIGKTCFDVFDREIAERITTDDTTVLQQGHVVVNEASFIKDLGGAERMMRTKKFVVPNPSGDDYLVTLSEDISERHRHEQALEEAIRVADAANRAKSGFLATMSHEIRTPLNGILGMAQAMANAPLSKTQRHRLGIIRESGENLLAILNDVLDLAKIEAGKLELENVAFALEEVVRGPHATFALIAARKDVRFVLDMADTAGRYRGDPTRLRQILYNLVSNAVKFTNGGEVRLVARYAGGRLRLEVRDTGIGMVPEVVDHLFEKFSQADASMTRQYGGTGLGLAICRELAELMGGWIKAESAAGQGSVFIFEAPLERLETVGDPVGLSGVEQFAPASLPQVLAAEDNPTNQLVLRTLLNQFGIDPLIVDNGEQVVAAWLAGEFDLILMDVQMPVMDGIAATRRIRELERTSGRAPTAIIALTANAMSHQVADYLTAGMTGFVAKPIEAGKLFETMNLALASAEVEAGESPS